MKINTNWVNVDQDMIRNIAKQYDRTEESLKEDVKTLREWILTQKHLPEVMSDKYIENFLILNKCSIEKSKKKIEMYYTLRSKIGDFYENSNPKLPTMQNFLSIASIVPVPSLTPEKYRVMVYKILDKKRVEEIDPTDLFRQIVNLLELRLKEDVIYGDVFVFDLQGTNLIYMMKFTPSAMAKMSAIYEKIFSIPMKGCYFVNSPPYINNVLAIMKMLLKPKLFDRVHACKDTSILECLSKECLPKDYGGFAPSVQDLREVLKYKFEENQARFDELDTMKLNEDLRPLTLENDDILGFYGNFKQLAVD